MLSAYPAYKSLSDVLSIEDAISSDPLPDNIINILAGIRDDLVRQGINDLDSLFDPEKSITQIVKDVRPMVQRTIVPAAFREFYQRATDEIECMLQKIKDMKRRVLADEFVSVDAFYGQFVGIDVLLGEYMKGHSIESVTADNWKDITIATLEEYRKSFVQKKCQFDNRVIEFFWRNS